MVSMSRSKTTDFTPLHLKPNNNVYTALWYILCNNNHKIVFKSSYGIDYLYKKYSSRFVYPVTKRKQYLFTMLNLFVDWILLLQLPLFVSGSPKQRNPLLGMSQHVLRQYNWYNNCNMEICKTRLNMLWTLTCSEELELEERSSVSGSVRKRVSSVIPKLYSNGLGYDSS